MTEDEMVGWHYQFNRHELQQMPGDSEAQGEAWHAGIKNSHLIQTVHSINQQIFTE